VCVCVRSDSSSPLGESRQKQKGLSVLQFPQNDGTLTSDPRTVKEGETDRCM